MTEFEIASIALQKASLWASYGQIAATVTIGLGQIAIVWHGIRAMQRAGDRRAREQDQRHAETMRRQDRQHAETMPALETLIRRTGRPEPAAARMAAAPAGRARRISGSADCSMSVLAPDR